MESLYGAAYDPALDEESDEEDDKGGVDEEYGLSLEPNVFGSLVLCCAKEKWRLTHYWHLVFAAFIAFAAVYIQFAFALVMIPAINEDELKALHAGTAVFSGGTTGGNLFTEWRRNKEWGGADTSIGDIPDAEWVCTGADWSWHESVVGNFLKYAAPMRPFGDHRASTGEVFGLVAIILWFTTIVSHMRYVLLEFASLLFVEEEDVWQPTGSQLDVRRTSYGLGTKSVVLLATVIRLGILLKLAIEGGTFLAHTDNLKDFILNSVALGFVLEIPTLFYNTFASIVEWAELNSYNENKNGEYQIKARHSKLVANSAGLLSLVVTAVFVGVACVADDGLFVFARNLKELVAMQACADVKEAMRELK